MTRGLTAHPRRAPGGDQFVEVVAHHGYRPRSIVARAGVPLRLVIDRREDDACMERIVFSSPHLDRRLERGTTTIVLPPQPAGEIRFTCGMGRYHGAIELRAGSPSSIGELRTAIIHGLRRGWRWVRGPVQPTVEEEAMAIVRARFARGEISEDEFAHARAFAPGMSRRSRSRPDGALSVRVEE